MFVMTIDQQDSRANPDAVPGILEQLAPVPTVVPFSRTIGDEVQGVLDDPAALAEAVRRVAVDSGWHIGIGVGEVETPLPKTTTEGRGQAFYTAREAVETAKTAPAHLFVTADSGSGHGPFAETALRLLVSTLAELRPQSRRYVDFRLDHPEATQATIADQFGVSQQAVSGVLASGVAEIVAGAVELARHHLDLLDRGVYVD